MGESKEKRIKRSMMVLNVLFSNNEFVYHYFYNIFLGYFQEYYGSGVNYSEKYKSGARSIYPLVGKHYDKHIYELIFVPLKKYFDAHEVKVWDIVNESDFNYYDHATILYGEYDELVPYQGFLKILGIENDKKYSEFLRDNEIEKHDRILMFRKIFISAFYKYPSPLGAYSDKALDFLKEIGDDCLSRTTKRDKDQVKIALKRTDILNVLNIQDAKVGREEIGFVEGDIGRDTRFILYRYCDYCSSYTVKYDELKTLAHEAFMSNHYSRLIKKLREEVESVSESVAASLVESTDFLKCDRPLYDIDTYVYFERLFLIKYIYETEGFSRKSLQERKYCKFHRELKNRTSTVYRFKKNLKNIGPISYKYPKTLDIVAIENYRKELSKLSQMTNHKGYAIENILELHQTCRLRAENYLLNQSYSRSKP